MFGKGRGEFLQLLAERKRIAAADSAAAVAQKSDESDSDSQRLGRGKLLDELMSSCSLGGDESERDSPTSSASSGLCRGRAMIFQHMQELGGTTSPNDIKTLNGTSNKPMTSCSSSGHGNSDDLPSPALNLGKGRGRAIIFNYMQQCRSTTSKDVEEKESVPDVQEDHVIAGTENQACAVSEEKERMKEANVSAFHKTVKTIHGNKGTPVKLACNYIRLSSDADKGFYVYEVRFMPNIDSSSLRIKYLNEHRDKYGGVKLFDGVTLYLPILLKDKLTTYVSRSKADNSEIEIRVCFKKREQSRNCLHLYNVLFDRVMKVLNYVRFDRKQFDPTSPKILPQQKLEVWPGYVTAVDEYEGGLMLCCDVSHRLLCQKTVLESLTEIYHSCPNTFQNVAKKALLGSVVITRYNNRTYRIDDICFDKNPMSTFQATDKPITYIDYYHQNYNINIRDKAQPLLMSIKKQRKANQVEAEDIVFCLIPEICYLTGLRDDLRSDFRLMREIATFTRVQPNQRLQALEKFYSNINRSPEAKQILKDWGLTLNQSYECVPGRQFDEEKIYFGKNVCNAGRNADFSRHATSNELLDVVHLIDWLLIHCNKDSKVARSFIEHVNRCSRTIGMKIQNPKVIVLNNDRSEAFVTGLRQNIKPSTQMVVCICPTNRDDRYSAIKKVCCVEMPVPSQVINAPTLGNETKNRAIVQKIVLQMNCKLGGSLWSVRIPFRNVMICGIDAYHDPSQKNNSVAAFVASLNEKYSKWYSKAIIQNKKEEIVSGLCNSFISALMAYKKENDKYPESVIIYRDGVGNGQLSLCENFEIPQFEQACIKVLGQAIKITFVIAQKRINTRYFTANGSLIENPAPGTVVDQNITRLNYYDFFLVSQSVRHGTVSPTHYIVLRDDSTYSPDILQRLTYKLCFMYYNWPGTIRIPACCQYAHKMAYLVGQNICRVPSETLSTKLFYL